ncbi:MAG: hypothetical protein WAO95_01145 [Burkholderiales bacterium]
MQAELDAGASRSATLSILLLLTLLFLAVHGPFVRSSSLAALEGSDVIQGDFTYYLEGAISVLQTDPYEKFNGKHQPIMSAKPVPPGALPAYTSLASALYPYPSFKFGYSLTAAALTWPFDQALFQRSIPRLAATNLVLGIAVLMLIFFTIKLHAGSLVIPSAVSLFYIFDVFNLYNNYSYQSHTIAGIFYALLAYYVFARGREIGPARFFVVANLLVFSLLASSHVVLLSMMLGGLMFLWVCLRERTWRRRFVFTVAGALGAAAWPAYIRFVEIYVGFKELGLPGFFHQFSSYRHTVSSLISTYPPLERQLWDLRLWNPFIVLIALLIAAMYLVRRKAIGVGSVGTAVTAWAVRSWNDKSLLLIAAAAGSLAGTAFYSQPIVRAIVPHLYFLNVVLGILVGQALIRRQLTAVVAAPAVALCLVLNFLMFGATMRDRVPERYVTFPPYAPSAHVYRVSEWELIWKTTEDYFRDAAYLSHVVPRGQLGQHSMSAAQFVEHVRKRIANGPLEKHLDELWVQFDPMELVQLYSNTRRYIPRFTPLKANLLDSDTVLKDYRLMNEILGMLRSGQLGPQGVIIRPVFYWNPVIFDQEYNYIYGYQDHIKTYIQGAPLADIDFRSIYYVKFSALANALAQK